MLVGFDDVLAEAQSRGAAAGAFTCYDLETAAAVLETAAQRDRAVVVLVSPGSVSHRGGDAFLAALLAYSERSSARTCVQVDHVNDLVLIARVLELGAGAVMADGSRLPLDENIALVREAVSVAGRFGAAVEAELGRVEGDEDLACAARDGRLTEPQEAERFLAETGAVCLAISIGNAHGRYTTPPVLDWRRLREIRERVDVPLALHGTSGIPEESVRQAVELGITKVNLNTELREAYLGASGETLEIARETASVVVLHRAQMQAIGEIVAAKLDLYDLERTR
jgi:tagatose 1,6-diphosphate aldolase GatY/KbaY